MKTRLFGKLVLACCGAALLCASAAEAAGTLRIGTGAAPMENVFRRIKQPFEQKTGIRLDLVEIHPNDALVELNADKIDVAAGGMHYHIWKTGVDAGIIAQLEARQNKLRLHSIGADFITILANRNVPVKELTAVQAKQIFTGQATNWRQVGGPDLPITVVIGTKVGGTMSEFKKRIMDGADFTPKAVSVGTVREMKDYVTRTSGAVTLGTLAQIQDGAANHILYPAVERSITIVWKDSSPKRRQIDELYQFLTSIEGKKYTLSKYPGRHGTGKK